MEDTKNLLHPSVNTMLSNNDPVYEVVDGTSVEIEVGVDLAKDEDQTAYTHVPAEPAVKLDIPIVSDLATGMALDEGRTGKHLTEAQVSESGLDIEKAKKLFGIQDQLGAITKLRNELVEKRSAVLTDAEAATKLDAKLESYDLTALVQLSDEEVNNFFTFDDGSSIEITLNFDNQKREVQFKRDFLLHLKQTAATMKELDSQLEQLDTMLQEDKEEFDKLISQFTNIDEYIKTELQQKYDAAEGTQKEKYGKMLKAYEEALTFDNIFAHYQQFSTGTTITDMYHRADVVFKKYMGVLKDLKISSDITRFDNLEVRFLEEKYHEHPNLFLFAIMKYIAYKKNTADRTTDGIFISQLCVNVANLFGDKFKTAEDKENFLASIRKVLDLFY